MRKMSFIKKHLKFVMTTAAICLMTAGTIFASSAKVYPIHELEAADEASQIVLVVGDGEYHATVSYYKKQAGEKIGPAVAKGGWQQIFTTPAVLGRNGISGEKQEGDGKTPSGIYGFTMAFGLFDNPGSIIDYHKIQMGDYWVDDPSSVYYNRLVNTASVGKSWKSAEDMMASVPFYNYGLVLDYNTEGIPGRGSAIFIHCSKSESDSGSAGCVRIPQSLMKQLVESVDADAKIIIVNSLEELANY